MAEHIPSQNFKCSSFSHLPNISLAHPYIHDTEMIDILFVLLCIMRSGVKGCVRGSLLAQETIFGWILTGQLLIILQI